MQSVRQAWFRTLGTVQRMAKGRFVRNASTSVAVYATWGMTATDIWRLLRENGFAIDGPYWGLLAFFGAAGLVNWVKKRRESRTYGAAVAEMEVKRPLFILGHWRSGTTLMHELLARDERFAYPTLLESLRPHTFLSEQDGTGRLLSRLPAQKRPMDNVHLSFASPSEDEWALAQISLRSPVIAWMFPRHAQYYERYLTFRDVPEREVEQWKGAMVTFLKKLTYRYRRPLILKSPPHTGRIRLLLDLFPDARFVHIHRNPYHVFRSTRRFYKRGLPLLRFQRPEKGLTDTILRRYQLMYDAFFEQRGLIPEGRYCEIAFEELEGDMLGQVEQLYGQLGLEDFQRVEPQLHAYVDSISGYKKNKYPPLPQRLRERIARTWRPSFLEWGYAF